VNGVLYTIDDALVVNPDGTWSVLIPNDDALGDGQYDVVASVHDSAGNVAQTLVTNGLVIDLTPPATP